MAKIDHTQFEDAIAALDNNRKMSPNSLGMASDFNLSFGPDTQQGNNLTSEEVSHGLTSNFVLALDEIPEGTVTANPQISSDRMNDVFFSVARPQVNLDGPTPIPSSWADYTPA